MRKNITWLIPTFIFFGILIPVGISFTRDLNVFLNGELVNVTITKVPHLSGTRSVGLMWFDYNNKSYYITVRGPHGGDFKEGQQLQLRYLKGYEKTFLFPEDNPFPWGITVISILALGGIGSLYYFFKR